MANASQRRRASREAWFIRPSRRSRGGGRRGAGRRRRETSARRRDRLLPRRRAAAVAGVDLCPARSAAAAPLRPRALSGGGGTRALRRRRRNGERARRCRRRGVVRGDVRLRQRRTASSSSRSRRAVSSIAVTFAADGLTRSTAWSIVRGVRGRRTPLGARRYQREALHRASVALPAPPEFFCATADGASRRRARRRQRPPRPAPSDAPSPCSAADVLAIAEAVGRRRREVGGGWLPAGGGRRPCGGDDVVRALARYWLLPSGDVPWPRRRATSFPARRTPAAMHASTRSPRHAASVAQTRRRPRRAPRVPSTVLARTPPNRGGGGAPPARGLRGPASSGRRRRLDRWRRRRRRRPAAARARRVDRRSAARRQLASGGGGVRSGGQTSTVRPLQLDELAGAPAGVRGWRRRRGGDSGGAQRLHEGSAKGWTCGVAAAAPAAEVRASRERWTGSRSRVDARRPPAGSAGGGAGGAR